MAIDDMHVVMYRILSYLYECMKRDAAPDWTRCGYEYLGIPRGYWTRIMTELIGRGYIAGVKSISADNEREFYPVAPEVTMAGVEFLMENSLMQRAMRFMKDVNGAVPFL